MPRKAHVPLEIDFTTGLDGKGFDRLRLSAQMAFIHVWNYLWHSGLDERILKIEAHRVILKNTKCCRNAPKLMQECRANGHIGEEEDCYIFLGLNKKRHKAFKGKRTESVPESVPKEKEEGRMKKGKGDDTPLPPSLEISKIWTQYNLKCVGHGLGGTKLQDRIEDAVDAYGAVALEIAIETFGRPGLKFWKITDAMADGWTPQQRFRSDDYKSARIALRRYVTNPDIDVCVQGLDTNGKTCDQIKDQAREILKHCNSIDTELEVWL